jgi:hypothetical protein
LVDEDEMVRDWLGYWQDNPARLRSRGIPDLLEHPHGSERSRAWLAGTTFAG